MTDLHFADYFLPGEHRVVPRITFLSTKNIPAANIFLFAKEIATRNRPVTKQHRKPTILRAAVSRELSVARGGYQ
jgi:hypothetical protein